MTLIILILLLFNTVYFTWRFNQMTSKDDFDTSLDAFLGKVGEFHQDLSDKVTAVQQAITDLLAKQSAGEDFSAEVDKLNAANTEIASMKANLDGLTLPAAPAAPPADPAAAGQGADTAPGTAGTDPAAAGQ